MIMGVDIETYSSIDLLRSGVYRYTEAPDFSILLVGYCIDGGEVTVLDTSSGEDKTVCGSGSMTQFLNLLFDRTVIKTAFNANFERTCLARYLSDEMPPEQWRCTMVKALSLGIPGSLAGAGMALGLPEDKLKDPQGKALIRYFSKPCRPTKANGGRTRNLPAHDPEKWKLFISYNRQDVVTEQEILKRLSVYETTKKEQDLWTLDQRMNDRGVRLDRSMISNIVNYDEKHREDLKEEAKKITGLANPNSLMQLKDWTAREGYPMESITKDSMEEALKDPALPGKVEKVLRIRQALGKTSVKKYNAMQDAICRDDRLRGILQFYGANRTGRWAGRLVQTHNLARNSLPDLDLARSLAAEGDFDTLETLFGEPSFVFSELIRTAFIPSDGCRFVVSDFSAIEARVLSWVSGEVWRLKAFEDGKDIYCETASQMYHKPVVKHGINGELRQKGKVAELACGYGGGVGAMRAMDRSGDIPEEEYQAIVDAWRTANPSVPKLWRTCERAAMTAIKEHRTVRMKHGIEFSCVDGNLFIKLPSGRKICYWGANIKMDPRTGRESVRYKGVNQTTRKWEETETWGGKIVENIIQAVARDCLAEAMTKVSALGYKIVMHVHDEMIVDVPEEDTGALERINACMADPIDWAPGLPLKGDGYETPFYRKD